MSGKVTSSFKEDGVCVVELTGEISSNSEEELQLALIDSFDLKCYFVIINVANADNIYAPAFKIISWAAEVIVGNNGRIILCGANSEVSEKLNIIGMDEVAELCQNLEEAQELLFK
ncbi:MAG: hypothetical protein COA79_01890 [Planctomycetota bacterium]|nr:MAG: hypothetical protein COA79_01890 [Planctomycetota bacterium]